MAIFSLACDFPCIRRKASARKFAAEYGFLADQEYQLSDEDIFAVGLLYLVLRNLYSNPR